MKKTALKLIKRILPVLLSLFSVISAVPVSSAASRGQCGPNLYWSIDNYIMTISGTGPMYDYDYRVSLGAPGDVPWRIKKTSFSRLVVEEGCESIGNSAFYMCETLSEIELPEKSLKRIGDSAFGKTALKTVTLPDSVETLEQNAFCYCEKLKELTFGSGISAIPTCLCTGCSSLEKITLSPACRSVANSAFKNCSSLKEANLESLETIEAIAFMNCSLTEATFGKDLKYMGSNAFAGCTGLSSVTFDAETEPKQVSNHFLDETAFYDALPDGPYTMFDGKVQMCKGTYTGTSIVIPEGVEIISDLCFDKARKLKSVTLPSTLKTICSYAFRDCVALREMTIPPSVENIGQCGVGFYTNNLSVYAEVDYFVITGKGLGYAFEYAERHNFYYVCDHECETVYDVENCSEGGTAYTMCTLCGACLETYPVEPSSSHTIESATVFPSCSEAGYHVEKCAVCNYERRYDIPAKKHTPEEYWVVVSLPDCRNTGTAVRYCAVCGEAAETIIIEKEDHAPSEEYVQTVAPTCTEPGRESLLCLNCGDEVESRELPPTGHVPEDEWINITLPSEDGTIYGCSVLKCRYCRTVLDVEWTGTGGERAAGDAAASSNIRALTDLLCVSCDAAGAASVDYLPDGVLNMRDVLALKQLSVIGDSKR